MPVVHTFEELVKYLTDNKIGFAHDAETQSLELPSQASPPLIGNLYIRWEKQVPFIQIIHFMAEDVPEDRTRELETAIVRLDNSFEIGGFGFDHANRRLYCRLTIPAFPADGINPDTINQVGNGITRVAVEFIDVFKDVINGKPGDQVIEIYKSRLTR